MTEQTNGSGAGERGCDADECFCCGKRHFCEPPTYPTRLGETWTCPGCRRLHESFDPRVDSRLPAFAVAAIPAGTFGWRSSGVRA